MNRLRSLLLRRGNIPPPQEPGSISVEDAIAARDVMWQERLQDFDVKPKIPPGPITFNPYVMDMQRRKCYRSEKVNGVLKRIPAPCPWEEIE